MAMTVIVMIATTVAVVTAIVVGKGSINGHIWWWWWVWKVSKVMKAPLGMRYSILSLLSFYQN